MVKFGPAIAATLRGRKLSPSPRWHLDEMVCKIGGERVFLWRAVDDEREVLDLVVQKRRETRAALKRLKQLLRRQPVRPESIITDGLASYGPALRALGREEIHRPGCLRENNRAETSHLPIRRRERKMLGFKTTNLRTTISDDARGDLQHHRFSTIHDQPPDAAAVPSKGGFRLGEGSRLRGIPHFLEEYSAESYPDSSAPGIRTGSATKSSASRTSSSSPPPPRIRRYRVRIFSRRRRAQR